MPLTGTETLQVLGQDAQGRPSGETFQTTTAAIAALADATNNPAVVNTAITTVGAGTLTAAAIAGGVITRSGSLAAYTDTTATAVQIVAALTAYVAGESFFLELRNTTAFAETVSAGVGVTLTGNAVVPANSCGLYLVTITSATAVTMLSVATYSLSGSTPVSITTLSTVGAGTITGAGIAGGVTSRTGSQSGTPFTDTTDTAAGIIAAVNNARIGQSWKWTYVNTTNAVATLAGGSGVTPSGITAISAGRSVTYLVTYTAAATITMVAIDVGSAAVSSQGASFAGSTSGTTALVASAVAGSTTQTLPAVTGVIASTTGTNLYLPDLKRTSASVTKNASAAYANVTGLSFTVVPGTYAFYCYLPSTVANGTGGIKYCFNYTTTVLSALQATGVGNTASAVATQQTTTTTTQTDLFTQAAVVLETVIQGIMIVTTGGTVDIQMAQNTSNGSDTVALINGFAQFVRIA